MSVFVTVFNNTSSIAVALTHMQQKFDQRSKRSRVCYAYRRLN
ncbi:MAG: hypothetical protein RMX96_22950 [Nostoc sp. ChiSLP02]|nr:hypothetical protein [Nostoc sp. DedSLP05]MDZ8103249.1 hypothetical protein [Nostoc sp. DedSLP01]MDZ8187696.1 hypothetical protein [Nostoc sp. ChiSLP02]